MAIPDVVNLPEDEAAVALEEFTVVGSLSFGHLLIPLTTGFGSGASERSLTSRRSI